MELAEAISSAVKRKKKALGGFDTPEQLANNSNRPMILIGG